MNSTLRFPLLCATTFALCLAAAPAMADGPDHDDGDGPGFGLGLGVVSEASPYRGVGTNTQAVPMLSDMLLAFTDGISDAQSSSGEFFGESRLLALLDPASPSASAQRDAITRPLAEFTEGAEPFDDVTFLLVQRQKP